MRGHHVGLFTVIGSLLSMLALAQAPSHTFTNLDVPFSNAGNGTFAEGINDRNQVVGIYVELGGTQHGFIEDQGKYMTLDVPGASHTRLFGINNRGQIVGDYTKGTRSHGFLYTRGRFTNLDMPGAVFTFPLGINDRGQVVGFYEDRHGEFHGFLYERGRFRTIDVPFPGAFAIAFSGINNRGEIAGCYRDSTGGHGFLYVHGEFASLDVPFPETFDTCALGINDHGHIVGLYQSGVLEHPTGVHGFVYEEGAFTAIDVPDFLAGINAQVNGINNRRQIVGFYAVLHEPRFSSFIATPTEDITSQYTTPRGAGGRYGLLSRSMKR